MKPTIISVIAIAAVSGLLILGGLAMAANTNSAGLAGSSWQLVSIGGVPTLTDPSASLVFDAADSRAGGAGTCNQFSGSYTVDGSSLTFGPLVSTMMACPPPLMEQEQAYLGALQAAVSYTINGDQLVITDGAGQALVFTRTA